MKLFRIFKAFNDHHSISRTFQGLDFFSPILHCLNMVISKLSASFEPINFCLTLQKKAVAHDVGSLERYMVNWKISARFQSTAFV